MPRDRSSQTATLAHDRAALSKRMGSTARSRRPPPRRILAGPPGALDRSKEEPRTAARFGKMDARPKARGIVRRERQVDFGTERARAQWKPPNECQPACERRSIETGSALTGLLRLY